MFQKISIGALSVLVAAVMVGCTTTTPSSDDDKVIHVEENDSVMMEDKTAAEMEKADSEPAGTVADSAGSAVKEFTVEGSSFKFVPNTMTVKEGDTVRVTFKNVGGTHNFVLSDFGVRTSVVPSGSQQVVEFVANKKGSFEYYCSVGDHRALGMVGTLIVE